MPVYLNAAVKEIRESEVLVGLADGTEVILPADSVITSIGYHPTPLVKAGKNIHLLGDCEKVGSLRGAIWGAWDIAMKL